MPAFGDLGRLSKAFTLSLTLGLLSCGAVADKCFGQEEVELSDTALALAPEDVAFFSTSVNLQNAWQEFIQGDFVTRLRATRYVRSMEDEFNRQWNDPESQLAQGKAVLNNPNVRNLLSLAQDMTNEEMFIYAGDDWCDAIQGLANFQREITGALQQNPEALQQYFRELEPEDIEELQIPTTVIGFRLSNEENARMQLDALEGILRIAGSQAAELQPLMENLRRQDYPDGQTLTITLDTSLIPLETMEEEEREVAERFVELFEGRSLSLSIGVKAQMLLIAFSEDGTVIDTVGDEGPKLLEHPSLDVLRESDMSGLRSVSFASARWRESQWSANFTNYFQNMSLQVTQAIRGEGEQIEDAEEWMEEIQRDAEWLDEYIAEWAPEFGDVLSWSQASESGLEGWTYDWNENLAFENASPLGILEHAGQSGLIVAAFKRQSNEAMGEVMDEALARAPEHIRRFIAAAEQSEEEREQVLEVFERSWPLAENAIGIIRDQILPALGQDETLIAVAGEWTTTELGPDLPAATDPLPLPEVALACRVEDREAFLAGCEELYGVFDEVVELVRDLAPEAVPADYSVPRPVEEELADGTTRFYYEELVAAVPLDGFRPQLLVTEDTLILGYSDRQVKSMQKPKRLATRPAWLTDETPVAVVSYVDFAGIFRKGRPWLKYGLKLTGVPMDQPLAPTPAPAPSGNDLLQIWDAFSAVGKAAATVTVAEGDDDATVTHWVWIGE